jgi:PAS domain-containing protein
MDVRATLLWLEQLLAPIKLNETQRLVLEKSVEGWPYKQMASCHNYDEGYLKGVGSQLWLLLSQITGQEVNKTNLRSIISHLQQRQSDSHLVNWAEAIDVNHFYGREVERATLRQWLRDDHCRLVGIFGLGGMGKTALTVKLAKEMNTDFEVIIGKSLWDAPPLAELLSFLLDSFPQDTDVPLPQEVSTQLSLLIQHLQQRRSLIILDHFDSLFTPNQKAGSFPPDYKNYREFLKQIATLAHHSCVLLTSREIPVEITLLENLGLPVRGLQLQGLEYQASQSLLQDKGLSLTILEAQVLAKRYQGNPFALKVMATAIQELFAGNVKAFLRDNISILTSIRQLLKKQLERLTESEKIVIYWLANPVEPLSLSELQEQLIPPLSRITLLEALSSLQRRSLIENQNLKFTVPSLIKDYLHEQFLPPSTSAPISQPLAQVGKWEYDIAAQKVIWSKELFVILDWDIEQGEPNYKQMLSLHLPEDQGKLQRAVDQISRTGEPYCVKLRHPCPDGSLRYVESIGHLERDAQGNPKRLYGITQDITYQVQAQMLVQIVLPVMAIITT